MDRFSANPMMLDDHRNSTKTVLGGWKDWSIEGVEFSAEPVFDMDDPDAAKVAGKVERNFIRACSMGIFFDYDKMELMPDNSYELTECELYEISICAVPSNAGCIALYTKDGELITDEQVKLSLSALNKSENKLPNTNEMEKIALTAGALVNLGLKNADDVVAVSKAIEDLAQEKTTLTAEVERLKTANEKLQNDVKLNAETAAEALVYQAELDGKITATTRASFKTMAVQNLALTTQVLGAMPGKIDLSAQVVDKGTGADADVSKVKTPDDFEKLSESAKLSFQKNNPVEFAALWA